MRTSKWRAALAGVLAAAGGLAAAELVGGALAVRQTPVVAIGSAFVDVVPGWMKDLAIRLFGTKDKLVLILTILVLLAVLACLIGLLAARNRPLGLTVVGLIGVVAAGFAITRPDSTILDLLPSLAAAVIAVWLLGFLLRRFGLPAPAGSGPAGSGLAGSGPAGSGRAVSESVESVESVAGVSRRDVMLDTGAVVAASLLAAGAGRVAGARRVDVETARQDLRLPKLPAAVVPSGADVGLEGLTPWRTSAATFYRIDTSLSPPLVAPKDWKLRVHGMVDHPVTLTFAQLLRRPIVDRWVTLTCVSNEVGGDLVGNAYWSGVRVADLLRQAGVRPGADAVKSTSADGWTCGTPLATLLDGRDALLAFAMNGKPLPLDHGFPVRMVVPGLYGYVSATKWLVDLEVTRFDRFQAYWTTRGWSAQGPIKTGSRIDVPRDGDTVRAGTVRLAGVAWAQHRGIRKVEARLDEAGPWREARLAVEPTTDAWRQWTLDWPGVGKGRHTVQVRATDGTGATQTSTVAAPAPNGASGWPSIGFTAN